MLAVSLREFTQVGHQLRWLARLVFWLLAGYSLRLWIDDLQPQTDRTRRSLHGRLVRVNTDFDTGKATRRGDYSMADETYD